jgi:hypothetical protein
MSNATASVSLAKALRLKNRLAGRYKKVQAEIAKHNSVQEGAERPDVRKLYNLLVQLEGYLVEVKSQIAAANLPINQAILESQELKGRVTWMQGLNTFNGTQTIPSYTTAPSIVTKYEAVIRQAEVTATIGQMEQRIDQLQDQIAAHNHRTNIPLPAGLFAPGVLTDEPETDQ